MSQLFQVSLFPLSPCPLWVNPPTGPERALHSTGRAQNGAPQAARALQIPYPTPHPTPTRKQPNPPLDSGHKGTDTPWRHGVELSRACTWGPAQVAGHGGRD